MPDRPTGDGPGARRWPIRVWATLAVLAGLLVVFAMMKYGAEWLASTDPKMTPTQKAEEVGRARTAVLAVLAGGLAAFGAFYTHRGFALQRASLDLNREGQITERFTRAVEQIGSANPDVRVGGIYGLERIAWNSREDHGTVIEILTTYVRSNARWSAPPASDVETGADAGRVPEPSADVQAALTVIGRRNRGHEPQPPDDQSQSTTEPEVGSATTASDDGRGRRTRPPFLDLRCTDLRGAYFSVGRHTDAAEDRAPRQVAHLESADFTGAHLEDAFLQGVHLEGSDLESAHLDRADLRRAHLDRAHLRWARLDGAHLMGASLRGADLRGACLARSDLTDADLCGARYSEGTIWPAGFDLGSAGALKVSAPRHARETNAGAAPADRSTP